MLTLLLALAASQAHPAGRGAPLIPTRVERLHLEPTPAAVDLSADVRSSHVAGEPAAGFVETAGARLRFLDDDSFWVVTEAEPRVLSLAGEFATETFNTVAVRLVTTEVAELSLEFHGATRRAGSTTRQSVSPRPHPQWIEFPVPDLGATQSVARIDLIVAKGPRRVAISDVELRRDHPGSARPLDEGTSWLSVGRDGRRGLVLPRGATAGATTTVPPESTLTFELADPLAGDAGERLVLSVSQAGREVLHQSFALSASGGRPWQFHRVALGSLAGEVRITFHLESGPDEAARSACFLTTPALVAPGASAPSVLLVTSDTHRADHVAGMPRAVAVQTPVLEELAARGIRFEDCLATTNVTNPSHIAIMTAHHPRDVGIVDNQSPLSLTARTLAESFSDAGWVTLACVSAPHLFHDSSGLGQGFDRMSGGEPIYRPAGATVDVLLRWLAELDREPVFVWLHVFDAHRPYDEDSPFRALYYSADRDPRDPDRAADPGTEFLPSRMKGIRDLEFPRALYRAEVSYLDRELGRLLAGSRLNTGVIAVTADHGESLGQHGIYFSHAGLFPDTVHVPLILTYPGCEPGQVRTDPVNHMQLAPTLLSLAGIEAPFAGVDLQATADGPRFALSADRLEAAVFAGEWVLILHLREHHEGAREAGRRRHQVELYHRGEDPACEVDRVDRDRAVAKGLRATLLRWLADRQELHWNEPAEASAADAANLAELGYAVGGSPDLDELGVAADCPCEECAPFHAPR